VEYDDDNPGSPTGVPVFQPHKDKADRVQPPKGTKLLVVSKTIQGSGIDINNLPEYYYITDSPSNGSYRRYFIKKEDVKDA
jgi:hypothetical protein